MPTSLWHTVLMPASSATALRPNLHIDLQSIEAGMPTASIATFLAISGLATRDIHEIVIPARTLKHRRARREPLTADESDKLARLVRVYRQAVHTLGDRTQALGWLNAPKRRFAQRTPLHMLRTEQGGRMVEAMLGQIDEGMFA